MQALHAVDRMATAIVRANRLFIDSSIARSSATDQRGFMKTFSEKVPSHACSVKTIPSYTFVFLSRAGFRDREFA